MAVFRFKQFSVVNERSAMKVNTDGVLLGRLMTLLPADQRLLDIGTGTGTIALMAAQRLSGINSNAVHIDAIDIDEPSVQEAGINFAASPWPDFLEVRRVPLQQFEPDSQYDLIFSNPPYFDNSLTNPDARDTAARHTDSLSYRDIFAFAERFLADSGRVALVLPSDEEARLCREARSRGLFLFRIVRVRTTPRKPVSRIIAEFGRQRCSDPVQEGLTIQEKGRYTDQYIDLLKEFLYI